MVRIRHPGSLTFVRDGQLQPVPTKLLRRTLALLLSRTCSQVQADSASIEPPVFVGTPPPTARRTLSVYISRLRQLLGDDDRVESYPGAYAICPRTGELDAVTFERLAAQAAEERHGDGWGQPPRRCGPPSRSGADYAYCGSWRWRRSRRLPPGSKSAG